MSTQETGPTSRAARTKAKRASRRRTTRLVVAAVVVLALIAAGTAALLLHSTTTTNSQVAGANAPTTAPSTSSSAPQATTTTTQAPGPGFVAGKVTAVGDSVMVDYQDELAKAIPGITIDAAVSRQWYDGITILSQMKAAGTLGATVIVGLATNGPLTASEISQMMSLLSGASHVIFINTHVDQPWQDPNNQLLAASVSQYKNLSVVDWYALANKNPSWFGPDQTHLAINGAGTQQLASLIAAQVSG